MSESLLQLDNKNEESTFSKCIDYSKSRLANQQLDYQNESTQQLAEENGSKLQLDNKNEESTLL